MRGDCSKFLTPTSLPFFAHVRLEYRKRSSYRNACFAGYVLFNQLYFMVDKLVKRIHWVRCQGHGLAISLFARIGSLCEWNGTRLKAVPRPAFNYQTRRNLRIVAY